MLNFHNNYIKNKYGEKAGMFAYRYWQAYLLNWNLTFLWRLSYTEFNKKRVIWLEQLSKGFKILQWCKSKMHAYFHKRRQPWI